MRPRPRSTKQAIDHMLSLLGDPATRRIGKTRPGDEIASGAPVARAQPSIEWPAPDLAIITASDYEALDASPTGRSDLARMIGEAAKANAIVFDIRKTRNPEERRQDRRGRQCGAHRHDVETVKESVPLPPSRYVYHQGYAPQTGPYPTYYSGLLTIPGGEVRIRPRPLHGQTVCVPPQFWQRRPLRSAERFAGPGRRPACAGGRSPT